MGSVFSKLKLSKGLMAGLLLGGTLGSFGVAAATSTPSTTVFYACLNVKAGTMNHISTTKAPKCASGNVNTSWNATGPKGDTGVSGTNGTNGAKGDTGAQGAKGDTGVSGTNGTNGAKGDTGAQGAKGDTGVSGTNGTNGAKGDTGAQGAKGDTGSTPSLPTGYYLSTTNSAGCVTVSAEQHNNFNNVSAALMSGGSYLYLCPF